MNVGTAGMILHVDDERSARDSLSMLLRAEGYVVSSAASGPEALQLASAGLHPDVLILDFNLDQHMNGAEVAEQIRGILHYAAPIIAYSADSHQYFKHLLESLEQIFQRHLLGQCEIEIFRKSIFTEMHSAQGGSPRMSATSARALR